VHACVLPEIIDYLVIECNHVKRGICIFGDCQFVRGVL